jgi:hypothetical protein
MNENSKELLQGYKVEAEHTDDPTDRLKIAADHLNESPVYYDKLKIMENTSLSKLQSLKKLQKTSGEYIKQTMRKPLHRTGQNMDDVYKKIPQSQELLTNEHTTRNPQDRESLKRIIRRFKELYVRK